MKLAIVGYGKQGRSAYDYWKGLGADITICDRQDSLELPNDVKQQTGDAYLQRLDYFDLIVRGPAVHPRSLVDANSPEILHKVTSVTNEFMRVCPSRHIIGVTGTKGKGTTSTLITKMLEADGRRVHFGGNVGIPPLDLLKDDIKPDDWVVLELANFQLIDLRYSPPIAVCLMMEPEHLDWHADTDEYFGAKTQLFRHQTVDDIAIYYGKNETSQRIASTTQGHKLAYMTSTGADVVDGVITIDGQQICAVNELRLLGKHNWQNVCAAVTASWQVTQNINALRSVLTSFSGLPFRLEFRREANGIRYYNDSFASAPPAVIAALDAIPGKKIMIVGGLDRGLDLDALAEAFVRSRADIRSVVLVGASAERMANILSEHGFMNYKLSGADSMAGIVGTALEMALPGDAIILSPGFPSFDMFKNFEDRGQQFNTVIEAL